MSQPLAERVRPKTLDDYVGQEHLIGPGGPLRAQIDHGAISSMILWGPPGTGKTTLALLLAEGSDRPFYTLSAINSGVKEVREVIERAKRNSGLFGPKNPILFIDEIHRFSKSQQDSLLGAVEKGWVTLIGATTENPSFEVIPALLSRCQVFVIKPLQKEQLSAVLERAIALDELLQEKKTQLKETEALMRFSGGDGRKLLNLLEWVVMASKEKPVVITNDKVNQLVQEQGMRYDKDGEQHYDIVSAYIKSIRGSDPNAAVYWLARMIEGGEDVKFIARRLLILASEDIGNANPNALLLANNTFQAVSVVGWPESRILLSQATIYLASSPKSNASYMAINQAQQVVKETGNLEVPLHLRNAPTALMEELGYGAEYLYAHDHPGNFVEQEFLPDELQGKNLISMGDNPREQQLKKELVQKWKQKYQF
ncbi:replication-associated recombination protein A [Aureicoccus marinus]|uniref:Replication-associated recombination protein A n=1 Tax=Aureicoccus marinus TaxID=754435 RepID=A0A2S7T3B2_9FLAO|nr:replication-associated recombination protein A [Aureicoccus marinus]PQJ14410.1 AAA family ATPase [Aureicoccus marinus]